jgi:predicted DNA-binding protein YlxM (UPF0122 family)
MGQCSAITRSGARCKGVVVRGSEWCAAHHPDYQGRRRMGAFRGGKSRASKATKSLHELLEDLTRRVIDGELETSRGAVANQLISTRIRLLEYERRLKELEEIEERLEALEQAAKRVKGGHTSWGV